MTNLLSIKEVAKVFGVSASTIRNMIKDGDFPPGFNVGRSVRWERGEVDRMVSTYQSGGISPNVVANRIIEARKRGYSL